MAEKKLTVTAEQHIAAGLRGDHKADEREARLRDSASTDDEIEASIAKSVSERAARFADGFSVEHFIRHHASRDDNAELHRRRMGAAATAPDPLDALAAVDPEGLQAWLMAEATKALGDRPRISHADFEREIQQIAALRLSSWEKKERGWRMIEADGSEPAREPGLPAAVYLNDGRGGVDRARFDAIVDKSEALFASARDAAQEFSELRASLQHAKDDLRRHAEHTPRVTEETATGEHKRAYESVRKYEARCARAAQRRDRIAKQLEPIGRLRRDCEEYLKELGKPIDSTETRVSLTG